MAAGNYDHAAEFLRRAVAEDPGNPKYLRALDQAEVRAAEDHFARAQQFWQMNRAWSAAEELDSVFVNVPAHPQAMLLNESVEQRVAEVERLTQQAHERLEAGDRDQAESLIRQAWTLDSSHPAVRTLAREMALVTPDGERAAEVPTKTDEQEAVALAPVTAEPRSVAPSAPPSASRREALRPVPVEPDVRSPAAGTEEEEIRSAPQRIARIVLSREDDRYRSRQSVTDGIAIELDDTDGHPLDADLEIRVEREKFRYKNQRVGAQIPVRGASGHRYTVVIIAIVDKHETVVLDLVSHDAR